MFFLGRLKEGLVTTRGNQFANILIMMEETMG